MPGYSSEKGGRPPTRKPEGDPPAASRRGDGAEAVVFYLADMTAQLMSMARAANLELLSYLLAMAHSEAESLVRKRPDAADDLEP